MFFWCWFSGAQFSSALLRKEVPHLGTSGLITSSRLACSPWIERRTSDGISVSIFWSMAGLLGASSRDTAIAPGYQLGPMCWPSPRCRLEALPRQLRQQWTSSPAPSICTPPCGIQIWFISSREEFGWRPARTGKIMVMVRHNGTTDCSRPFAA